MELTSTVSLAGVSVGSRGADHIVGDGRDLGVLCRIASRVSQPLYYKKCLLQQTVRIEQISVHFQLMVGML